MYRYMNQYLHGNFHISDLHKYTLSKNNLFWYSLHANKPTDVISNVISSYHYQQHTKKSVPPQD